GERPRGSAKPRTTFLLPPSFPTSARQSALHGSRCLAPSTTCAAGWESRKLSQSRRSSPQKISPCCPRVWPDTGPASKPYFKVIVLPLQRKANTQKTSHYATDCDEA